MWSSIILPGSTKKEGKKERADEEEKQKFSYKEGKKYKSNFINGSV